MPSSDLVNLDREGRNVACCLNLVFWHVRRRLLDDFAVRQREDCIMDNDATRSYAHREAD